ncbi:MAG: alanine dehydrogenase [Chloroflexi bacterium RBG_16_56_11]|nr:MAG: alanine dehydrogenase [Chloroflexi bacterium RBG_16_56_11]
MIIGILKEIKRNEYRVGMVPAGVRAVVESGHRVILETAAGEGSGISDDEFRRVGAEVKESADAVFSQAEMIVKVKEPLPEEWDLLNEGQILFTYLHLAPSLDLTRALLTKKVIGIAYETVQLPDGSLPLLEPMSEIAGKLSVQVGAYCLQREHGGGGILLGGVPGVKPASVVIIGGGTVGMNAAGVALGMGARVTILDVNIGRLRYLHNLFGDRLVTVASNKSNLEAATAGADLIVGATLVPGARAEKLITRPMLTRMRKGTVLVDVAVDQRGCCETSVPTTHDDPVFVVEGVLHYCVANMPSAVSRSSTFALTNVTLPYILKLADLGPTVALRFDVSLQKGLNVYRGQLVSEPVAKSLGLEYRHYDLN